VTEAAVIDLRTQGWTRLAARLRDEDGVGLVELLIALMVLNIGIFATLAAFSGGALALRRASHVSTATAIADQYTECMRNAAYDNIQWPMPANSSCPATSVTGADGRTYDLSATVSTGSQLQSGTYQGSTAVKVVTLTVTDPQDSTVVVTSSSTFSQCAQDMTTTACQS
jgi:type II secretory pathway pseudopilin PulG